MNNKYIYPEERIYYKYNVQWQYFLLGHVLESIIIHTLNIYLRFFLPNTPNILSHFHDQLLKEKQQEQDP